VSGLTLGLILAGRFGAPPAQAAFTDVSQSSGVNLNDHTYGLAWSDFNGDSHPDLLVVRHYFRPIIYRNLGNGQFNSFFFPQLFDTSDHHGPLIGDFDNDGDPDIYLTSGADGGGGEVPKRLYRNDGNFEFLDVAIQSGCADSLGRGRSSSAMDVDGDGALDFFVAKAPRVVSPNSLFMNDGTGHFTDIAGAAGLADDFGSVGGIWGDYDRDRDPDLLIGGEESAQYQTRLYRNNGDLTFTNVTSSILPGVGNIAAADWGDYDHDGDLDLAIGHGDEALFDALTWNADSVAFFFNARGNDNGLDGFAYTQTGDSSTYELYIDGFYQPNLIFISEDAYHPGPISPFTLGGDIFGAPSIVPGQSVGAYLWTDGLAGLWQARLNAPPGAGHTFGGIITTNGDFTEVPTTETEPYEHGVRGSRIYRNDGGIFVDVSQSCGIADTVNVRQIAWVDYDQDGHLDLFVMNKGDTRLHNEPDILYHNDGQGVFTDVTAQANLAGPTGGLGDAFSFEDYDSDGDLDVAMLSGTGPRYFSLHEKHKLYRNDGPVGNHLRVQLEGVLSTKNGYGAWVTCISANAGRQSHYVTGNSWRGGHKKLEPLFGLGADTIVDTLIVEWPSRAVNVLTNVDAGNVIVTEAEPALGSPADESVSAVAALRVQAQPNPSSGIISFELTGRSDREAELKIYDTSGRLIEDRRVPGTQTRVFWDGRTRAGAPAASGIYFARIREDQRSAFTRFVLLRQ
jgi:hypothetical protein